MKSPRPQRREFEVVRKRKLVWRHAPPSVRRARPTTDDDLSGLVFYGQA
ncbi:hypothetical protein [Phenylobacterium sp.]|jgi:ribosomal protein L15E